MQPVLARPRAPLRAQGTVFTLERSEFALPQTSSPLGAGARRGPPRRRGRNVWSPRPPFQRGSSRATTRTTASHSRAGLQRTQLGPLRARHRAQPRGRVCEPEERPGAGRQVLAVTGHGAGLVLSRRSPVPSPTGRVQLDNGCISRSRSASRPRARRLFTARGWSGSRSCPDVLSSPSDGARQSFVGAMTRGRHDFAPFVYRDSNPSGPPTGFSPFIRRPTTQRRRSFSRRTDPWTVLARTTQTQARGLAQRARRERLVPPAGDEIFVGGRPPRLRLGAGRRRHLYSIPATGAARTAHSVRGRVDTSLDTNDRRSSSSSNCGDTDADTSGHRTAGGSRARSPPSGVD